MPEGKLPPSLKQFLDQLRQQPPEHIRKLVLVLPRHLRAQLPAQLRAAKKTAQPPAPKPKHAGGNLPKLTKDEIDLLQAAYSAAQAKEKRKRSIVFQDLRQLLPKAKRGISDRTLRRYLK